MNKFVCIMTFLTLKLLEITGLVVFIFQAKWVGNNWLIMMGGNRDMPWVEPLFGVCVEVVLMALISLTGVLILMISQGIWNVIRANWSLAKILTNMED